MSFLEKLKKGIGVEDEGTEEERINQEDFKVEELEKPRQQKKKIKKIKAEEKFVERQEEKEIKEEIKTEEKKWPEPEGQLAVDVYQTDGELVIQSAIAGVKPEDLDITAQGDTVIIRGKREGTSNEAKNYFYQECYWGSFSREIILPVDADISHATAEMVEGVLTIRIPKIEREKEKKIVVK